MSDRPHRQQWKHATVLGRRKMRRDHRKGWSSIHLSVPCMKMATRQDLLNRGANANAVNNANDTPLCVVARGTSTDCQIIVGALVDRNANPCPFCGIGVDLPYVSANLQIVRDVSKRWTGSLFPNAWWVDSRRLGTGEVVPKTAPFRKTDASAVRNGKGEREISNALMLFSIFSVKHVHSIRRAILTTTTFFWLRPNHYL